MAFTPPKIVIQDSAHVWGTSEVVGPNLGHSHMSPSLWGPPVAQQPQQLLSKNEL